MNAAEKWREYKICIDRGHVDSNVITASVPPWKICKKCGCRYRYPDPVMIELDPPRNPLPRER